MAMKDRLDDALQSRSLSDNLIAPCHLSTQSLRRLVRNPDFWQEAAGIELRKNVGVDRRFDLGIGNDKHLFRLGDPHLLHMRRNHSYSGRRVAGWPRSPRHRSATRSRRMSTRPCHCFGEGAVNIQSDDKHARSSFLGSVKDGSWRATRHLLIRARSASGKVARGGHVTSSGSQPTVY